MHVPRVCKANGGACRLFEGKIQSDHIAQKGALVFVEFSIVGACDNTTRARPKGLQGAFRVDMNEIRWDGNEPLTTSFFVADLDQNVRTLFFELRQLDGGYALLRLLNSRKNAVLMADDLAYYLGQPERVVVGNLRRLVELGWARRVDAIDWSWFGLTDDPKRRAIVQELIDWEELWYRRLNEFQRLVGGAVIQP